MKTCRAGWWLVLGILCITPLLSGCRTIHSLVIRREMTATRRMLQEKPESVAYRNAYGETPLHLAVMIGEEELVTLLLEKGAAYYGGDTEAFRANILEARDKKGRTPLHMAAWAGWKDGTSLLLKRGADVNAADNEGSRPLDLAAEADRDVADLIRRYGGKRFDSFPLKADGQATASAGTPEAAGATPAVREEVAKPKAESAPVAPAREPAAPTKAAPPSVGGAMEEKKAPPVPEKKDVPGAEKKEPAAPEKKEPMAEKNEPPLGEENLPPGEEPKSAGGDLF